MHLGWRKTDKGFTQDQAACADTECCSVEDRVGLTVCRLMTHDEGSCWVPAELRSSIILSHWGRKVTPLGLLQGWQDSQIVSGGAEIAWASVARDIG